MSRECSIDVELRDEDSWYPQDSEEFLNTVRYVSQHHKPFEGFVLLEAKLYATGIGKDELFHGITSSQYVAIESTVFPARLDDDLQLLEYAFAMVRRAYFGEFGNVFASGTLDECRFVEIAYHAIPRDSLGDTIKRERKRRSDRNRQRIKRKRSKRLGRFRPRRATMPKTRPHKRSIGLKKVRLGVKPKAKLARKVAKLTAFQALKRWRALAPKKTSARRRRS